ncbi:MAG: asparagine synthase (glutamine-hydrolyzing) [Clostridiales bacterium 38-18]|nr:MAG: asparagine synthase (glutamine-hydrolyzing) [Clostridiales bacterium 38-18]
MCGFVGYTHVEKIDGVEVIKKMSDAIAHRGPDSDGAYVDEQVALGFRRLSIIDLTDEGKQPMFNENEDIVLVFNGEVYNYQALREELIQKGHRFHSHTDSEVILHGYEEYGVKILDRLRGMFAFSIWDMKLKKLFIARDYFGIKPLYYTQNTTDGSLIFGSEIKSFLQHPKFIKKLNKKALRPYLTFQYSSMDETFFEGVYKLKPAHYLVYEAGKLQMTPYWHNEFKPISRDLKENVESIKQILKESVEYHRISDVKVGSFLSGGIDSSYITALLMPNKTFSVGFTEYEAMFNETKLAGELSDLLGIENHKKIITPEECFDALPKIQYHMDEPQSNPSSVPLYFLAGLAREHVTVVLSGEGADEIFAGYPWYQNSPAIDAYEKVPFGVRRAVSKVAKGLPNNRVTNFLVKGGMAVEEKFIGEAKVFDENDAMQLLKPDYQVGPSVRSITQKVYDKVKDEDDLTKMQYLDLHLWLPGDILLKADKMSMAHSLELRVPFLDREVMQFASTLPKEQRVNRENTKYALRVAANEILPEAWAKRPKLGFPVPIKYWMKEEKFYNLIKGEFDSAHAAEFFDTKLLVKYLDEHYTGTRNRARYIWTVYVFLIWHKQFFPETI